ncbi:integrase, catalytic region, zinc finger, CCHC-type containing protein [Tanacetum coccineum]
MSTQQDIYAAGSENRPPMLNKENYVPWSSRLLRYAKSRQNGKLIYNSIMNGPYVRRMIPEPGDADREVPVPETFHEQTDDELTHLQTLNRWKQMIMLIQPFFSVFIEVNILCCCVVVEMLSRHVTIVHQTKDLHTTDYTQLYDFLKYNQKEVDDQRAERLAKTHDPLALMANSNNPFNYPVFHQDQPSFNQNYMQQPMPNPEDITDPTTAMNMALVLMAKAFKLNYSTPTNNNQRISSNPRNRQIAQPGMNMGQDRQMQMVGANGGNQFRQYAGQNVGYQNGYNAVQNEGVQNVGNQNGQIVVPGITNQNPNGNGNVVAARAEGNATGNNGNQIRCYNCRGLGHLARNCTVRPRRRDAAYLQTQLLIAQKEEAGIQLQAEEFDLMAAAADLDEIEDRISEVDETNDLSKPVTSNSVPTPQESKIVKHDNVIAPGMFRINPFKPSREEKYVPNKVRASVRTTPITVSQPHVVTKKDVNSDSNGLSSTGVDNTAKTRRPQPRSNTKNDRVPSASKSSCNKNKEVEVEEHHRNLLLSKNKKHMSSECKHVKLDTRNDQSEVICAMCKQCLITANHDVCMLNYVNDMNSRGKKQKANVSNTENQKKQKPKVKKPKKVGSNERLASPKPSNPRFCLRWSPTGRFFDIKGKIITSSESESQSDCSNGDNACTSNPSEPKIKRFPNSTSFLGRLSKFFLGTVRFGNDHVAAILGFGDLQWGNILITRVYFVEGLGHNLFSVGQFCDSDLEVAFRRNSCFVRNLDGVDLLKGNRSTNLYTINLHEMASASPICLMARATSTKSWLWHQRLSHLNFDTINDLAKNDLQLLLRATLKIAPSFTVDLTKHLRSLMAETGYLLLTCIRGSCYPKNDHEDIGKLGAKG